MDNSADGIFDTDSRTGKESNHPQLSVDEWAQLCQRFSNGCALCGKSEGLVPELVVPVSLGGTLDVGNIQPLCVQCCTIKRGHLVDYRPFEPLTWPRRRAPGIGVSDAPDPTSPISSAPKMITQKQLLAIEHQYGHLFEGYTQSNIVEDPIVDYDVAPLLIEEVKRLRALIIVNPALAYMESIAWRERYVSLVPKPMLKPKAGTK